MTTYIHPGMRLFLDGEAERLGLAATVLGMKQWARATRAEPLRFLDDRIAHCVTAPPEARADILRYSEAMLAALALSLATATRFLEMAYRGFGIDIPGWVVLPVPTGDTASDAKTLVRKGRKSRDVGPVAPSMYLDILRAGPRSVLASEAQRLGIADTLDDGRPVAWAMRSEPLGIISSQVGECLASLAANREEVLGRCFPLHSVLVVSLMAGIRGVEAAYRGYGLEVPSWVSLGLLTGEPEMLASA